MKKVLALTVAAAFLAMTGAAMADTATVQVSASVSGVCKVTSVGNSQISFTLNPATGGNVSGVVTNPPTFWCTKGQAYTIGDDKSGAYVLKSATTSESIPYNLGYSTSGTGAGKGHPATLTLTSTVDETNYINASAATDYADTVTLTIAPTP